MAADLTTLSSLGLALQKDGTLQFTAATFTDRAAGRPADVRALLAARMAPFLPLGSETDAGAGRSGAATQPCC